MRPARGSGGATGHLLTAKRGRCIPCIAICTLDTHRVRWDTNLFGNVRQPLVVRWSDEDNEAVRLDIDSRRSRTEFARTISCSFEDSHGHSSLNYLDPIRYRNLRPELLRRAQARSQYKYNFNTGLVVVPMAGEGFITDSCPNLFREPVVCQEVGLQRSEILLLYLGNRHLKHHRPFHRLRVALQLSQDGRFGRQAQGFSKPKSGLFSRRRSEHERTWVCLNGLIIVAPNRDYSGRAGSYMRVCAARGEQNSDDDETGRSPQPHGIEVFNLASLVSSPDGVRKAGLIWSLLGCRAAGGF